MTVQTHSTNSSACEKVEMLSKIHNFQRECRFLLFIVLIIIGLKGVLCDFLKQDDKITSLVILFRMKHRFSV